MGYFINIKHTHLVTLVLTTWKNKHTTTLKRAPKQYLSLENEYNQQIIDVEAASLGEPGLDAKKKAQGLFSDILNLYSSYELWNCSSTC